MDNFIVPFVNIGKQYLNHRDEILNAFDSISRRGDYILSNDLKKFEEEFADYCGTKYAVGLGCGADALLFGIIGLGIGKGDEVIVPTNSFVASAWSIALTGARPRFIDAGLDYNLNADLIEKEINSSTKAIMPVHLTGKITNMSKIIKIANKYNLKIIEDAAQAVGATQNGKRAGSFGDTGCFSLHPLKNLHVHGDGGIVVTDNENLYHFLKKLEITV